MDAVCPYGLGASVFTRRPDRAEALSQRLRTGVVTVNDVVAPTAHPESPFGGVRASGWGVTQGAEGLLEMTVPQTVSVRAGSWKPAEPFPDFDAALMRDAAAAGVLRLGTLHRVADGQPVAAQYWILDQGGARATVPKLFHLESERAASPGTVLTAMMLRHLMTEDRVRVLDFGRGDDAYKAHWVSDRVQLIGLVLADPRHPAGLAALARQQAGALIRRARGMLGR